MLDPELSMSPNPPDTALEDELKRLIVDALKLDDTDPADIDPTMPLVGTGLALDSIDILELAMAIQREYGVRTSAEDAQNHKIFANVRNLAAYIGEQRPQESAE